MTQNKADQHERINDILLGPIERAALNSLAKRMPAWVTPDILTGIGLGASATVALSLYLSNYSRNWLLLAAFGIFMNWFGDSLDGTLARYRHIERPRYGFFTDHATDAISSIFIFGGMGLSPYFDFSIALIGLIAWLTLSIMVYLVMIAKGVFKISMGKFGPTELRVIGILALVAVYFLGTLPLPERFAPYTWYDFLMLIIAAILMAIFIQQTISLGIELSNQDNYTRIQRQKRQQLKEERIANKEARKQQRIAKKKLKASARHGLVSPAPDQD